MLTHHSCTSNLSSPKLAGQHERGLAVHVAPVEHARHVFGLAALAALLAGCLKGAHQQLEIVQPPLACAPPSPCYASEASHEECTR